MDRRDEADSQHARRRQHGQERQLEPPERDEPARRAIARVILRHTEDAARHDSRLLRGLTLVRFDQPTGATCAVYEPGVALIVQGAKRVVLGRDAFDYGAGQFLISALNLPAVSRITEASPSRPYLGLFLRLDLEEITRLMIEGHVPSPPPQAPARAMATGFVNHALTSAVQRLLDLLDEPENIGAIAPLIRREILYRLLVGEHGWRLRQIVAVGSQSRQVADAVAWLNDHFQQALSIEELSRRANMSPSTLHHHFRALTAMSPLQYQKSLRLNEARRLMLAEHLDAASAAFRVGYESASQFSREYSRQFGAPPLRDVARLRAEQGVALPLAS